MESRFERQLKKGRAGDAGTGAGVWDLLTATSCWAAMARRSNGLFALKEGTLYPILYRLEDDGLIEAQWRTSGAAPHRKILHGHAGGSCGLCRTTQSMARAFADCVDGFDREEQL